MPSERSARVTQRRSIRNRSARSSLRTYRTRADRAIAGGAPEVAEAEVKHALRALDQAAGKGIIHRNRAARTKSRLARRLNAALGQQTAQ